MFLIGHSSSNWNGGPSSSIAANSVKAADEEPSQKLHLQLQRPAAAAAPLSDDGTRPEE